MLNINYNTFIKFIKELFFDDAFNKTVSKDDAFNKTVSKADAFNKTVSKAPIPTNNYREQFNLMYDLHCTSFRETPQPDILPKVDRIVAIGDIHGDFELLKSTLKLAKVIDDNNEWIGGKTIIVQVGDQIDRCRDCNINDPLDKNDDWNILKYMTMLNKKAESEGGAVYSLLGNHEIMNSSGDFRYVSKKGLTDFNINDDDKKYLNYEPNLNIPNGEKLREWAFSRGKPIGNFLACTRKVCLIIGSNIFVHGGIIPDISKDYNITDINKLISLYLFDEIKNINNNLINEKSPLMSRELATVKNKNDCDTILNSLDTFIQKSTDMKILKVGNIIVGHTPNLNGIKSNCNNKIWLTDYGASIAFNIFRNTNNKKIQFLEILNDTEIKITYDK
jgi:hypothetical protein